MTPSLIYAQAPYGQSRFSTYNDEEGVARLAQALCAYLHFTDANRFARFISTKGHKTKAGLHVGVLDGRSTKTGQPVYYKADRVAMTIADDMYTLKKEQTYDHHN